MYDKILVPLDGSTISDRGLQEALALAQVMKSSLLLLHVIDNAPIAVDMVSAVTWQEVSEGLRKHGQGLLDRASNTAAAQGVASETRLVEGRVERVSDTIVSEARSAGCQLVVMGTHGRSGFSHALLGSNAERVVRQCAMPVLLVR
jgi:nucleotide-binding universal stress UspA family protein